MELGQMGQIRRLLWDVKGQFSKQLNLKFNL